MSSISNSDADIADFALCVVENNDPQAAVDFILPDGQSTRYHPFVGYYSSFDDLPNEDDPEYWAGKKVCYICKQEEKFHRETVEQFVDRMVKEKSQITEVE